MPTLPLPLPCTQVPAPPAPQLPSPFTIGVGASLPTFNFDPALCCKVLPFEPKPPPIPIPPGVLNPAVVAVINQALAAMATFFDGASFGCPLE